LNFILCSIKNSDTKSVISVILGRALENSYMYSKDMSSTSTQCFKKG